MQPELFVTCDFASDQGGKLTLVGVFDRVAAPTLPAGVGNLGIGLRLRLEEPDLRAEPHKLDIRLIGPNDQPLANLNGALTTQRPPGSDAAAEVGTAQIALNMVGAAFPNYGRYRVELWVDDRRLQAIPIFVTPP